jgi:hypothetical protein
MASHPENRRKRILNLKCLSFNKTLLVYRVAIRVLILHKILHVAVTCTNEASRVNAGFLGGRNDIIKLYNFSNKFY